jgi:hypothetical protein
MEHNSVSTEREWPESQARSGVKVLSRRRFSGPGAARTSEDNPEVRQTTMPMSEATAILAATAAAALFVASAVLIVLARLSQAAERGHSFDTTAEV